jgi:phage tail-like protein
MAAAHSTPFTNMRFRVEVEGAKGVGAVEVILPAAHREIGPGGKQTTQLGTMTLRRGLTRSSEWYDWWSEAQGSPRGTERAVRVVLVDESGADAIAWLLAGAVPIGYAVSSLNALGHEPVIESLELSVKGFEASFGSAPRKGRRRA